MFGSPEQKGKWQKTNYKKIMLAKF